MSDQHLIASLLSEALIIQKQNFKNISYFLYINSESPYPESNFNHCVQVAIEMNKF